MSKRGILTDEIQNISKEFLGRKITTTELQLYPYLDFCLKNNNDMDRIKINDDEIDILEKLYDEGHVLHTVGSIICTKEFYDYVQNVLKVSYVEKWL